MENNLLRFFILSCLLLCQSCSYGTYFIPKQTKVYGPTTPENIAISPQRELKQPYEMLGRVAVIIWGDGDSAREALQDEASKLGANAIIRYEMQRSYGRTSANGLAVRVFSK